MLVFLDFEASSLDPDSYPVEVAWVSHDLAHGYAAVIRPLDAWRPRLAWNPLSAGIHGLSYQEVTTGGVPAADVARRVARDLSAAKSIVSDQPGFDAKWLRRLMEAAPGVRAPIISGVALDAMLAARERRLGRAVGDNVVKEWASELGLLQHRALDDTIAHALRLASVALEEVRVGRGQDAARQARDLLTARARGLLERWRRQTVRT